MKSVISVRSAIIFSMIVAGAVRPVSSQVNVLTHHNDNRRSGANLRETQLTVANVKQKFGKLWTLFADGQIVAQPLYVSGLNVDGKGTFNAVIMSTMHNTIYVYDADKKPAMPQSQDALIWAQWLGQPQPENSGFDSWNTNFPEYGILSTPVVNDAHTILYVVSWHNGAQFRLHAIDLTKAPFPGPGAPPPDYREKIKPVRVITAGAPKPGGGQVKLDVTQQKQRSALLLDNGVLYLGFSTNRETGGDLHGWLLAYDAATLQQKAVWNVTPSGINGGIWQAGSGPAADESGNVYLMTGNGNFNANTGGKNFGDSFVKLKLEGTTLAVKDYFTPCNQSLLNRACGMAGRCDLDLGSAGPLLLPGTAPGSDLLIGGGKDGNIYVVNTANMGHFQAPPGQVNMNCPNPNAVQSIMGPQSEQGGQGVVGNIHGSHVFWQGPDVARVFVWGEDDVLRSYEFKNGKLVTPPAKSLYQVPPGMPGGMLSLSANGNQAGSGVVWALLPYAGDANQMRGVRAQLLAFDAQNIKNDIFQSSPPDDPDGPNSVGLFAKFAPPTIANGKVFIPTYGDHENPPGPIRYGDPNNGPPQGSVPHNFYVAVYGLKP
jgi:hypothetical protein